MLQKTVIEHKADIGIALDGDADRLIVIDEQGEVIDGDYLIATIANAWKFAGKLKSDVVVATIMSNMGMEKYLNSIGLNLTRTNVGDKFVIQKMVEIGANIGGEKSGNIVPIDYSTTGDGCISAIQILSFLQKEKKIASEIRNLYVQYNQVMFNIPKILDLNAPQISDCINTINTMLHDTGRIVIRKSGTEPVTRVMIEAQSATQAREAEQYFNKIMENVL